MILAHNEEEEMRYPLCYPRVRLRHKSGNREFLTVSYPFQFFGSAVGANSTLAFTGNSIGMSPVLRERIRRSMDGRVPKTVLSRLMLERSSLSGIERLLRRYPALLPAHWYVASRTEIRSAQMRPRASVKYPGRQFEWREVEETTSHTNHFQHGPCASWFSSKREENDSKRNLERLQHTLATSSVSGSAPTNVIMGDLQSVLEEFRMKWGKEDTAATIVVAVGRSESRMKAYDHFDGGTVELPTQTIHAW
jgi:hypothetical protein